MSGNVETEFKLRAQRRLEIARVDAVIRESTVEVTGTGSHEHHDTYLDDAQRSLARHGIGLRVRVGRSGSTITCKRRARRDGALFVREEFEALWPSHATPSSATVLPDALRDAVEPVVQRRPLIPVLRIDVQRERRDLALDGSDLCELVMDTVTAHGAGRTVEFSEIEIEVVDDVASCETLAAKLEGALHVEPASHDKPTHAAHLLGIALPNDDAAIGPETATTTAVLSAIRTHLAAMQQAETSVRQDHDPDHVHAMRVALRRLRSITSAFRELWPPDEARWMRQHLRALAAELGRVRDLDVMIDALPGQIEALPEALRAGGEWIVSWVRNHAARARADLVAWLRTPSRLDDGQRFAELAAAFDPGQETNQTAIAVSAQHCLTERATELRRRTRDLELTTPMKRFHQARLATKRLRYLMGDFGPVLPDTSRTQVNKLAKRLSKLQQTLGKLCDEDTALQLLLDWSRHILRDSADEPLAGPALGALMQQRSTAEQARRRRVARSIRRLRRKLRLPS